MAYITVLAAVFFGCAIRRFRRKIRLLEARLAEAAAEGERSRKFHYEFHLCPFVQAELRKGAAEIEEHRLRLESAPHYMRFIHEEQFRARVERFHRQVEAALPWNYVHVNLGQAVYTDFLSENPPEIPAVLH